MTADSPLVYHQPAPPYFVLRTAFLFAAPFFVNGVALPFFPVWLRSLSMTDLQIGLVLSVPLLVRVITAPVAGVIADRIGERADVLIWSAGLSLLTALAFFMGGGFWVVLIVYGLQGAVYSPYVPIVDSIALSGVRRWGFDYGRIRVWGSLSFIVATMMGGMLIGRYGGGIVLPVMAAGFVLTVIAALLSPKVGRPRRANAIPALETPPNSLRQKDLQLLLLGVTLVNGSHAMLYAFSALYWQQLGFTGTQIAVLWSAGVLAEVLVFMVAKNIRRHVSVFTMILSGCALAVVRWILFPLGTDFLWFLGLQCLHAFTYAIMHSGMQGRIVERVSEDREASAQGLYFFYTGTFTAFITLISGSLFERFHVYGFWAMGGFAFLGLFMAVLGWRLQPHSLGSGGRTKESR